MLAQAIEIASACLGILIFGVMVLAISRGQT